MEIVRLDSWERRIFLLITILVPALATWFWIADHVGAVVRALATLGAAAISLIILFVWSVIKLPSIVAEEQRLEIEKLQADQDTAAKVLERRNTLGIMLHNANEIAKLYHTEKPLDEIVTMADGWRDNMVNFADGNLDEAHKALLWSNTGILIGEPTLPTDRMGRWRWLTYRAVRLQEIIRSL